MNDRLKESISALMDDEVNELELQRILSHADHHELASIWQRYHRVREVLTGTQNGSIEIDVRKAVSQSIEQNAQPEIERKIEMPVPVKGVSASSRSRMNGFLAIAASVAFALIFVFQNSTRFDSEGASSLIADMKGAQAESTVEKVSASETTHRQPRILVGFNAEHAKRFNTYLLRHSEYSTLGSQSSVMPLVRVASVNSIGI